MSEVARKQIEDCSAQVDEILPIAQSLAESGKLTEGLDKLNLLEKVVRNAADLSSCSRVLIGIVSILHKASEFVLLNEYLLILTKKHGQLRLATVNLINHCMEYINQFTEQTKLDFINTLRTVTEGKIYLEVQRARVTKFLSEINEASGDITTASDLLQELQVETFSSMERREKVEFVLEQMRLLKLQSDYEKFFIVSKRINLKWLQEADHQDLKLRFYELMIIWGLNSGNYLEVCKFYRAMYDTPSIESDSTKFIPILRNIVYFIVLSPYDNEQSDLLARISKDENLTKLPEAFNLTKCFTTPELMRWPGIEDLYGKSLQATKVFGTEGVKGVEGDITESLGKGAERWQDLHSRVVEHNIRTISHYYTRISLTRLSQLLDLTIPKTEESLSKLVTLKTVYAKIDRPAGVVSFVATKRGDDILNEWSSDVGKLMGLIEKSCHLIAKEHAVHSALKSMKA